MTQSIIEKDVLTTFEAAEICNSSLNSIKRWIQSGEIDAYRTPGGHYRICRDDLKKFLIRNNIPFKSNRIPVKRKVLIVDDDQLVRNSISKKLGKLNSSFDVLTASNGFEAGTIVAQNMPDIIILDLMMPVMDGFSICRGIKESPFTKNIIIIAITGFANQENIQKAYECGADKVLCKPVKNNVLVSTIDSLISDRPYLNR